MDFSSSRTEFLQKGAREQQRLACAAKRGFAGTSAELQAYLQAHAKLVLAVVAACAGRPEPRKYVMNQQLQMRQSGDRWGKLAAAIDRLLAGERDSDALCKDLDPETSMIVETILSGMSDRSNLHDFLPEEIVSITLD